MARLCCLTQLGMLLMGVSKREAVEGGKYCWQHAKAVGTCATMTEDGKKCTRSPSHRQAGMFPANGEERSSPLYLLKGINGQD